MNNKIRKNLTILWIVVFCLTQLSGCSSSLGYKKDGPINFLNPSQIADATPKAEPLSKYGNKSYRMGNHHYHVLKSAKDYKIQGIASWYGAKFNGHTTSSHEKYDLFGMTAASPTLPLPTYIKVKNLKNGKEAILRVNDRGPFRNNRILDVSYAAAKKLDFVHRGIARVEITVIDPKQWQPQNKLAYMSISLQNASLPRSLHAPLDDVVLGTP